MAGQLEARVVISAQDDTAKAFTSLKERIAGIEKMVAPLNKAMAAVEPTMKAVGSMKMPSGVNGEVSKMAETIGRVDRVMANVNRSAATMAGNVGKTSAEVVALSGKLIDAGAKLKAIQDFKGTNRGVKEAALAAQKAQQDARILAAKIDGTPTPTRSLQAAHMSALAEVRETEVALAKQVQVAATARTALAELGVPIARLSAEEERLKSVLDGTNAALLRQIELEHQGAAAAEKAAAAQRLSAEQEKRHHDALVKRFAAEDHARHAAAGHAGGHDGHGVVNYALTSAAMAVSAHEIGHIIAEGWHEGADLQHERMQLKNAGRTPEEMREMEAAGRSAISDLPTAGFTETMKVMAETTSAFGSVHHAIDNLPFMMKAMSVLKSAGGDHIKGDAAAVGQAFAKTFEERQTHAEDFQKEASAMIPAMVATGGLFNPEQLYAFAQQAKSALPNYDMRFLSKIAPSLITAQGGERAGTAANAFNSIVMGKVNDKKQTEAWEKFGLLDDSKVLKKAGHAVSWTAGAVKETDLALTDPLEWAEKVVLPAMRAKGVDVDNRLELAKVLGTMFRNQNGNMFANEIMQAASRGRLHKDEALYNKTGNLDEIYKNDLGEFNVASGALGESLKTLGAAATAPMMHRVGEALSWLAGELNQVSAFGLRHPTMAATAGVTAAGGALAAAGWIGKKLWDGFGLKGSAVALDRAAAHLMMVGGRPGGMPPGPGGEPHGPTAEPNARPVEPGAKAPRTDANVRTGIYDKPPAPSELPKGGVFSGGGFKGLASGLAEGVVGALVYAAGEDAIHTVEDRWLNFTPEDRDRIAKADPGKDLAGIVMPYLDRWSGRVGDKGPADPFAAGDREGMMERARRGAAAFRADPEAVRGERMAEHFAPARLGLEEDDRETRARRADRIPIPPLPPVRPSDIFPRPFIEGRTKDDVAPLVRGGGPVPVSIVNMPPAAHDGWLDGDRPGIEERSRRGAAMFRQDHEGTVGQRMMEHDVSPHVDDSQLVAFDAKLAETQSKMQSVGATNMAPTITSGNIDAFLAKLDRAASLMAKLQGGVPGGGTSGSLGASYPTTAPTGRQGGPR